jgi:ABC-type lipoprotein export system ATPase subunit
VGLAAREEAFPGQLAGGERQRVAVARALINGPGLLLCDEPTGNLDRERGGQVVSLLVELAAAQGVTVLMVTHNLEHAARFGRVLELRDGRLVPLSASPGETR